MKLLQRTLATAVAVALAAFVVQGIAVTGSTTAAKMLTLVVVALVIGVLNAFVKPVVKGLTGCIIVLTLGLFLLVINAGMLLLASAIAQWLGFGFYVAGFGPALIGSIIISIVSGLINGVLGSDDHT